MAILLMTIDVYSIYDYWCLFYLWLLMPILFMTIHVYSIMTIDAYSIYDYWCLFYLWLFMYILFMTIDAYSIYDFWCLLMATILVAINGYFIGDYLLLLY
jgi:hypothetical protein